MRLVPPRVFPGVFLVRLFGRNVRRVCGLRGVFFLAFRVRELSLASCAVVMGVRVVCGGVFRAKLERGAVRYVHMVGAFGRAGVRFFRGEYFVDRSIRPGFYFVDVHAGVGLVRPMRVFVGGAAGEVLGFVSFLPLFGGFVRPRYSSRVDVADFRFLRGVRRYQNVGPVVYVRCPGVLSYYGLRPYVRAEAVVSIDLICSLCCVEPSLFVLAGGFREAIYASVVRCCSFGFFASRVVDREIRAVQRVSFRVVNERCCEGCFFSFLSLFRSVRVRTFLLVLGEDRPAPVQRREVWVLTMGVVMWPVFRDFSKAGVRSFFCVFFFVVVFFARNSFV